MAKLEQKGKKWYVRIWLKDQQRYKWIPTNSHNKVENEQRLKEVNRKEWKVATKLQDGIESVTIIDAKDEWIKDIELELKPKTIKSYELMLKDFLKVVNGNRKVSDLCSKDYRDLKQYYANTLGVCNTTINHRLRSLKAFLNWCIDQKYLSVLPFKIKRLNEGKKEARVFNSDEFQSILLNTESEVLKSYFRFAYYTGMRLGEINASEWIMENERNYIKITKTKRDESANRIQPIVSFLRSDWEMIQAHQYLENRITKGFTKAVKLSGCYVKGRKTFHALRHSYGCVWVNEGKPLPVLSKLLGHSSIKVTNDFYIDADPTFFEGYVANA